MAYYKSYDYLYKILLVGDSNVGKTEILSKIVDADEQETMVRVGFSSGIDFGFKDIGLKGKHIKLQIWDAAGQERFHTLTKSYYKGALGIMLIYDITNQTSFESLEKWMENIQKHADESVEIMIIGNNCDREERRKVSKEMGKAFAEKHQAKFVEVASKDNNSNIDKAFADLAETILVKMSLNLEKLNVAMGTSTVSLNSKEEKVSRKRRCF